MSGKLILSLLGVTVLAVAGALLVTTGGGASNDDDLPDLLYADLESKLNDVASITITNTDQSLTITRASADWRIDQLGGYPATFEQVKQLLVTIAGLEPVAAKTSRPENYNALGVEDPSADGAESTLVRLDGKDMQPIASLIVGTESFQGTEQRVYVRKADEAQSWLVRIPGAAGRLELETDPLQWTERAILQLGRDRVQSVTVAHPGEPPLVISRDAPTTTNFTPDTIPEGRQLTPASANPVASSLSYVSMNDVRSADPQQEITDPVTAEYQTFNGLIVRAISYTDADNTWVRFDITHESQPEVDEDDQAGAPTDPAKEAAELQARLSDWEYKLSDATTGNLRKRLEDLLAEQEGPPEPGESDLPTPLLPDAEQPLEIPAFPPLDAGGGSTEGDG